MVRALPGVPPRRVHWAFHHFIACLISICANTGRIRRLSGKLCPIDDSEAVIHDLVAFFASGLKAPRRRDNKASNRRSRG